MEEGGSGSCGPQPSKAKLEQPMDSAVSRGPWNQSICNKNKLSTEKPSSHIPSPSLATARQNKKRRTRKVISAALL